MRTILNWLRDVVTRTRLAAGVSVSMAFVVATIIYLRTMMPTVEWMDIAEFQTVTYVLGIAHPTGYPLYIVVGKVFGTLVPTGEWAGRMNLMSVLCTATAAALLVVLALRYEASPPIALAGALGFAFTLNTWKAAGHADPYTLTLLLGASLWLMTMRWADTGEPRRLWTIAFVSGVGLGSAMVLVMELPAIILYALLTQPRKFVAPKTVIVAGLLGVLGVVGIYAYLPLRAMMHPPLNYGNTSTWHGFRQVALAGQVGGFMSFLRWGSLTHFIENVPTQAVGWYRQWLGGGAEMVVGLLALIGLGALTIRDWRFALCVMLGIVSPMWTILTVFINETSHYLLISNWLLFFLAALGMQALVIAPIRRLSQTHLRHALSLIAGAAALILPYYLVEANWSLADMHEYRQDYLTMKQILSLLKPGAIVFSWWGPRTTLWYGQYFDGLRPDVEVVDTTAMADHGWVDETDGMRYYYGKRPVYTLPFFDQLARYKKKFHLHLVGDPNAFGGGLYEIDGLTADAIASTPPHK